MRCSRVVLAAYTSPSKAAKSGLLGLYFQGRPPGLLPFRQKVTTRSIKGLSEHSGRRRRCLGITAGLWRALSGSTKVGLGAV